MNDLVQIQETLAALKNEFFGRFRIKTLAVFGSYARNEQKKNSDVDIMVEFDSSVGVEFIDLADYLEGILKLKVDLVSRNGIKPKYYNRIRGDLKYV